jgi:hypothetical protein
VLTVQERLDLVDLGHHWGEVYALSLHDGTWVARPEADPATVLTAHSADALRT